MFDLLIRESNLSYRSGPCSSCDLVVKLGSVSQQSGPWVHHGRASNGESCLMDGYRRDRESFRNKSFREFSTLLICVSSRLADSEKKPNKAVGRDRLFFCVRCSNDWFEDQIRMREGWTGREDGSK